MYIKLFSIAYPISTHHPISFLGLSICLSVCLPVCLPACVYVCLCVCLSVCLMWWREQTVVILQGYMCTYIHFFIDLTLTFGPFTSSFVFCFLGFKFCLQKGFFPLLSFAFCVLTFSFLLLSFVSKLLYIVFWLWVFACQFYDKKASQYSFKIWQQTNIQTDRQTIDSVSDMGRWWK